MVTTVRPNAIEIPVNPMAEPASTAAPQPPRTSHQVPIISATSLRPIVIGATSAAGTSAGAGR